MFWFFFLNFDFSLFESHIFVLYFNVRYVQRITIRSQWNEINIPIYLFSTMSYMSLRIIDCIISYQSIINRWSYKINLRIFSKSIIFIKKISIMVRLRIKKLNTCLLAKNRHTFYCRFCPVLAGNLSYNPLNLFGTIK